MPMNLKQYIDVRDQDINELYEDWEWLLGPDQLKSPILMSMFGDLVYQGSDGKIYHLDTISAEKHEFAESLSGLQAKLNDPDVRQQILLSSLVSDLADKDVVPSDSELYSFKVPPHLGGAMSVDNIEITDKSVALSMLGQIWEQTKDMTPGTNVSGFGVVTSLPKR